jgi:hypothetical protein
LIILTFQISNFTGDDAAAAAMSSLSSSSVTEFFGQDYEPYISLDPLNDPKSFTFRIKVYL